MGLLIATVCPPEILGKIRERLPALSWRDGARTAGAVARIVKHNEQADLSSRAGAAVRRMIEQKLHAHPLVRAAASPRRWSKLILSRTQAGGGYGAHVDNALMQSTSGDALRTDLSFTLFLSEPDSYEGGALILDSQDGERAYKPAAGDMVLYPSGDIHRVEPVTAGERLACVGWVESLIPNAAQRAVLFDLETLRADLRASAALSPEQSLLLDKVAGNLLRLWARP